MPPDRPSNGNPSPTVAILLAAGESRRMGQLKALLPWQGSILLRRQVESLLEGGVDNVVVVVGHRGEELKPHLEGDARVTYAFNPDYLSGKTTSLKVGVATVRKWSPGCILILNVDQPRSAETIRRLLESHRRAGGLITGPAFQNKGGHPLVVSASLLEELAQVEEATLGLKAVTLRHEKETHKVDLGTPEVLWDLNTPEDYREVLSDFS